MRMLRHAHHCEVALEEGFYAIDDLDGFFSSFTYCVVHLAALVIAYKNIDQRL